MPTALRLVVGLGNPGAEYAETRHNAGFWFVDALSQHLGVRFSKETRFHGEVARVGNVWLLKPGTWMNRSGQAVNALAGYYHIHPAEILVAHDEMDLPAGTVKMKIGGSAGSNGIKDIVTHLGTRDFWRLRLGVGHPRDLGGGNSNRPEVVDYVLHRPGADDRLAIEQVIGKVLECWPDIAAGEHEKAMQTLHSKDKPAVGKTAPGQSRKETP